MSRQFGADPPTGGVAIDVSGGDQVLARPSRYIYSGSAAMTVVLECVDGSVLTLSAVPSGSLIPIQVVKVRQTGTTATDAAVLF